MENKIITSESELNPPDRYAIYTKRYGETISSLKPGFDETQKYEKQYKLEVPSGIMDICKELRSIGGRALLVGGCVRDMVISQEYPDMDIKPKDFDVEVYGLSPETLQLALETKFGSKRIGTVGKAYEVIKVRVDGFDEPLDFSIPRSDSKSGPGHKGFIISSNPAMSIPEAALRRDLTINSMAYDPLSETVYDPFNGLEHIRNKVIEITDAKAFKEDPLRVLRVMQFASRFEFSISEKTTDLCKELVESGELDTEPKERVTEEMKKLLVKGLKPSIGLKFARETGVVERYWPQLHALIGVQQEEKWHPEGDVWTHTLQVVDAAASIAHREKLPKDQHLVLLLATLCHDLGKPSTTRFFDGAYRAHGHEQAGVEPTKAFFKNFNFPQDIEKQVTALVPEHLAPKYFWEQEVFHGEKMNRAVNRLALRLGNSGTSISMLSLLAEADQRGRSDKASPLERDEVPDLNNWQNWLLSKAKELNIENEPPERLLKGGQVLQHLGIKTGGPWLSVVLDCVYGDQIDGNINSQQEALDKAAAYYRWLSDVVKNKAFKENTPEEDIWKQIKKAPDPRALVITQPLV